MSDAFMSVDYYDSVLAKMGEKATKEFYRLFLIPSMFHCRGGIGCDTVDWLTPIVDWVEKGKAPDQLPGSQVEGGVTKRTRPHCPYPQVAKYKGAGSIDAAENFTCVGPDKAGKKYKENDLQNSAELIIGLKVSLREPRLTRHKLVNLGSLRDTNDNGFLRYT